MKLISVLANIVHTDKMLSMTFAVLLLLYYLVG